jgi:hypothetical protein
LIPTEVRGARDVSYPPGKSMTFAFSNDPLSVYEGEVAISFDAEGPVVLVYQACDATRCLSPVEIELITDH